MYVNIHDIGGGIPRNNSPDGGAAKAAILVRPGLFGRRGICRVTGASVVFLLCLACAGRRVAGAVSFLSQSVVDVVAELD